MNLAKGKTIFKKVYINVQEVIMSNKIQELKSMSKVIRKDIVTMLTESASGHPGDLYQSQI